MRPKALQIYEKIWPGCRTEDLREKGVKVHILDKHFGIDALIHMPGQQWISIQEKYRSGDVIPKCEYWNSHLPKGERLDFTQEFKNAADTPYESDGEWFKLGAQLYFIGWANKQETDFEKWVLIDVALYKMTVERQGGLDAVGVKKKNDKHGSASFYAIPLRNIRKAILVSDETISKIHGANRQH